MKKTIIAVIILTACATACTKKVSMPSDPEVGVNGITTVTASVADYEGQTFVWSPDVRIGISQVAASVTGNSRSITSVTSATFWKRGRSCG